MIQKNVKSGPDKTAENQVGASGWFVRLNLFARSQNRPFGGLAVWWFGRLAVIKDIQSNQRNDNTFKV